MPTDRFHGAQGYYFNSPADKSLRVDVTGDEILELFDFNADNMFVDISALATMSCFFFLLCFLRLSME